MNKLVAHNPRSTLAGALSVALLFVAGGALAQDPATDTGDTAAQQTDRMDRDSDQPISDTWITTKVKSSLLADTDVAGLDINVETVNGVVTLTGDVESQAQIDEAVRIAGDIDGVVNVDSSNLTVRTGTDY